MSMDKFGPLVNDAAKEIAINLVYAVNTTFTVANTVYSTIPGNRFLLKYAKDSYQNDPFRLFLDFWLIVFMIWYFVAKRYNPTVKDVKLTEKEIDQLILEWEPEPLTPKLTDFQKFELEKVPTISGPSSLRAKTFDGKEKLNFASYNFLGIMNSESVKEKAIETLRNYGVGTCGPPGFYGTLDVHMELEKRIAEFTGLESSIIYSQGFSCISSVIPAFAKRGDILVVDEAVNFAIQKGAEISRSHVYYFKHNDVEDLEKTLAKIKKDRAAKKLPLVRQFIVVEGLYANTGDICPLPEIVELKKKYKYRLMVEESLSFGVIGVAGRGVSDYFEIPVDEIDFMIASMSNSLASSGGFCAGSEIITDHQILSGQSYTFSASLPAILAVAATEAINQIENEPNLVFNLNQNAKLMHQNLVKSLVGVGANVIGVSDSPVLHLSLAQPSRNREDDERLLQEVVDLCLKDGILLTRAKYVVKQERSAPPPSIRVSVSAGFTKREIEKAASVIRDSFRKVMKNRTVSK